MELSIEYIAGFFDGEGSVGIYRNKLAKKTGYGGENWRLSVNVGNVDPIVVRYLKERYGGSLFLYERSKKMKNRQDAWYWMATGNGAAAFLREILPYSLVKKQQIELALEYQAQKLKPGQTYKSMGRKHPGPDYAQKMKDLKLVVND